MSMIYISRFTAILLYVLSNFYWLSHCIEIAGIGFGQFGISSKNLRSHFASTLALFKALNSNSIVDQGIQICLEDFQGTTVPSRIKDIQLWILGLLKKISKSNIYLSCVVGYLV